MYLKDFFWPFMSLQLWRMAWVAIDSHAAAPGFVGGIKSSSKPDRAEFGQGFIIGKYLSGREGMKC